MDKAQGGSSKGSRKMGRTGWAPIEQNREFQTFSDKLIDLGLVDLLSPRSMHE